MLIKQTNSQRAIARSGEQWILSRKPLLHKVKQAAEEEEGESLK